MHRGPGYLIIGITLLFCWASRPQGALAQATTPTLTPGQPVFISITATAQPPLATGSISAPVDGASLHGSVTISGSAAGAWNLSFSYLQGSLQTWFPLAQSSDPLHAGVLATWDTRNLTDGLYNIKLSISTDTGIQDIILKVRVNNYSFIETDTPTFTVTPTVTSTPTASLTPTLRPTGTATVSPTDTPASTATVMAGTPPVESSLETPVLDRSTPFAAPTLGPNPAVLSPGDIVLNLGKGILVIFGIFLFAGFLLFFRRK